MKIRWFWVFALISGALFLAWGGLDSLYTDEVEHLHASYLVSQGLLPYKDFWQHHSPFLWLCLAPVLKFLPQSAGILVFSRILCLVLAGILFCVIRGISKLLWKEKFDLGATLFIFISVSAISQFLILRPDIPMLIFSFCSIYLSLRGIEERKPLFHFFSGVCISLAVSFSPKLVAFAFLFPLYCVLFFRKEGRGLFSAAGLYVLGFLAGAAPLLFYLYQNGLTADFYKWVVAFHTRHLHSLGHRLDPEIALCMAALFALAVRIFFEKNLKGGGKFLVAMASAAILATTFLSFPVNQPRYVYYLAPVFMIFSIGGSWLATYLQNAKNIWSKTITGILLGALLLSPNIYYFRHALKGRTHFSTDLKIVDRLIQSARGGYALCLYPWHPIYVKNVNAFYSPIQMIALYRHTHHEKGVREGLPQHESWAEDVLKKKPSVISNLDFKKMAVVLRQADLLTEEEERRLIVFIQRNYSPVDVEGLHYFVKNKVLDGQPEF